MTGTSCRAAADGTTLARRDLYHLGWLCLLAAGIRITYLLLEAACRLFLLKTNQLWMLCANMMA